MKIKRISRFEREILFYLKTFKVSAVRQSSTFDFLYDCFESCGVVHCEFGENLAVDLDTRLMDKTHEHGI